MLFVVVHEVPGRLRARVPGGFSRHFVPTLREALEALPGVTILALNARTGGVLCRYADTAARAALLQTLGRPKEARRTAVLPVGRPSADATAAPASRAVGARFDSAGRKGGGRSRRAVLRHGAHRLPPPFVPLVRYFILRPLLPGLVRAAKPWNTILNGWKNWKKLPKALKAWKNAMLFRLAAKFALSCNQKRSMI